MFAASKSGKSVGIATDPYFKNVTLLLEPTSTNGQQNNTFLDSSTNNYTLTRSGTPTQGSFNPYWPNGYWSNYLNGSSDYLSAPSTTAFAFGASVDFTVECWVYLTAYSSGGILGGALVGTTFSASSGWFINSGQNIDTLRITTDASGTWNDIITVSAGNGLPLNQWTHIAFVRNGAVLTLYKNGVSVGSLSGASAYNFTSPGNTAYIGFAQSRYVPGYISNVRIVKGTAVYTGAFTPPTSPLTAITNTTFLTCQTNRFKDNSTNNFTITTTGTPQVQAFQPFSPPASYTAAAYGGSIYNGTKTDTITATSVAALTTFTGDFTIESWVYPTDTNFGGTWGIIDTRTSGGTPNAWVWGLNGYSSGWTPQFYNGSGSVTTFSTKVQANTWTHVVLQRNGSTVRCFVNGVVDATTGTVSGTITGGSSTIYIANTKDNGVAGYGNIGYTSNLRMVNGTAVYSTSGFTPPTAPVTAITNTSLLTNFTNAGIYDAAVQNNEVTVGSAQASTTTAKWSPTSIKFNGTTDYLTIPSNPVLAFGTGDFTVEGWIYPTSTAQFNLLTLNASFQFFVANNLLYIYDNGTQTSGGTITSNAWQHIAIARSGTAMKCFVNGVQAISVVSSTSFTQGTNQVANNTGASYGAGYVQDLRVTKGVARYTANFTPPTAAFPTR